MTDEIEIDLQPIRKVIECPAGNVYLLPVSKYPIPSGESEWVRNFSEKLIADIRADLGRDKPNLRLEVIIRQGGIYTGLLERFVDNAPSWLPEQGLAIIPHRPPPHLPTKEEVENIDPRSIGADDGPPVLEIAPELIFRIGAAGRAEAFETMGGHSALHVFLTDTDESNLRAVWKRVFGANVTERIFRAMPLYVPLFGVRSFLDVTEEKLNSWLSSFDLYVGESLEDRGVIIFARDNIDTFLDSILHQLPPPAIEPEAEILRW